MPISDQTRKVLWGGSGHQCAKCKASLVAAPAAASRSYAIVGQECHIVARSAEGPRGNAGPRSGIDEPANLILLCANCHAVVDAQPEHFTVDELRKIKADHEAEVQRRLAPEQPAIKIVGRDRPVTLELARNGDALMRIIGPSVAMRIGTPEPLSADERRAIGDFLRDCQDWSDIAADLGPAGVFDGAECLDQHISELLGLNLATYAGIQDLTLTGGVGGAVPWPEAVIQIKRVEERTSPSES